MTILTKLFVNLGHIDFPPGDGVVYNHDLSCNFEIHVAAGKVIFV